MKIITSIVLIVLIVFGFILPGCTRAGSSINGSGKIIDKDIELKDFTRVALQGPFNLEIVQSDSFRVTLSTDDNLISRILISPQGETVKFSIEAPANFFPTSLKVKIAMPRIYGLNLTDGTKATFSEFKSTFNFSLSLAESTLTGFLEAGNSDFRVSKNSQVNLKGSAIRLDLDGSGMSKIDLGDFTVTSAGVTLKEESEATLNVNGRFDVHLEGASKLYYLGNPTISDTSISGGSFMKQK